MPVSACNLFYHHSELKTIQAINNLKAYTDGEEGEGGNSGTQTEVYPPLPVSWGKEKESPQTGQAPRVFCQPLAFARTTCLGSIFHLHRDLQHRVTKHNKVHPKTPTSTSAGSNLQGMTRLVRKNHRTPRQDFKMPFVARLEVLAPRPSRPPPAPAQLQSGWARTVPPWGWEPVSPPARGKPPAKFAHRARSPPHAFSLTLRRGQAAYLPALGSPAACRARSDGERGTLQW